MQLTKSHLGIFLFTIAYVLGFAIYYLSIKNYEFLWYVLTLFVFIGAIAGTLGRTRLPAWTLFLLSLWGLLHMAGGGVSIGDGVLYTYVIFPFVEDGELTIFKFDQFVHAYGFGVSALIAYILLAGRTTLKRQALMFSSIFIAMGLGALNEIIEFAAVIGPSETGVGGYFNTSLDLVFNAIGAVCGAYAASLMRR